jgi:hypothetical protein
MSTFKLLPDFFNYPIYMPQKSKHFLINSKLTNRANTDLRKNWTKNY